MNGAGEPAQSVRHGRHGLRARLALLAVSTAAAFGLAELLARVAVAEPGVSMRFAQDKHELARLGRGGVDELLTDDPELFWKLVPGRTLPDDGSAVFRGVVSNAQGLREDHALAAKKPPGELRVLFLGDSCTFGTGLALEQGFVELAERRLRERFPGRSIECVNAGVPGYTLFQGWRLLATRGAELAPDLVVATFGWNDASRWDAASDREHFEHARAARPPGALAHSRLLRLAWRTLAPPLPHGDTARARVEPAEFSALLHELEAAAGALGADLALVVWPGRFNLDPALPERWRSPHQQAAAAFARARLGSQGGADGLIDLVPVLRELAREHGVDQLFQDQVHATALANEAYARTIAERVAGWLERRDG